jgi:hypothetical protein
LLIESADAFSSIHSVDMLTQLPPECCIGHLDLTTVPKTTFNPLEEWAEKRKQLPPLEKCLNVYDFEVLAKEIMETEGWAYYNSGSFDEFTLRENHMFVLTIIFSFSSFLFFFFLSLTTNFIQHTPVHFIVFGSAHVFLLM